MKKPTPPADYAVGYGKPPTHTRFQKGQSGNPHGRPKGKLNLITVLNRALNEKVVVVEHGRRRSITKLEAAFKQLVNKAVQGDPRAIQQVLSLGPLIGVETPRAMTQLDADEAAVMQQLLGRLTVPPSPPNPTPTTSEDTP